MTKVGGIRKIMILAGGISRGFAARDGSAVKSHSTILQRLRRQISLDYFTIPPATQANDDDDDDDNDDDDDDGWKEEAAKLNLAR